MAGIAEYRQILVRILTEYAWYKPSVGDIEVEAILDDARDHYEILHAGWLNDRRIHGPVIHIDIRKDKIWIQHDGTEDGSDWRATDMGSGRSCHDAGGAPGSLAFRPQPHLRDDH